MSWFGYGKCTFQIGPAARLERGERGAVEAKPIARHGARSRSGAKELRPRVGFSPKTPQHEAGIRIDPPPSFPWAMGTIRAATAAAEPPLEPPAVRSIAQGFRVGPNARGSVVGRIPNSGVFVLPRMTKPARLYRATSSLSWSGTNCLRNDDPELIGTPACAAIRSFKRNGTPRNGPSGTLFSAAERALSNMVVTTAFTAGFRCSIRAIAASTSSTG